ncbi:MAG TPA: hypothetical protein VKS60_01765 [Stellaceae bacterium]|nr:hypothetical protein [Stellaceae bacterium]
MALPAPELGLVVSYAYLWHSEYQLGREEGVKDRPCAIVLIKREVDGDTSVTVVPITHVPPASSEDAVELPAATKRRLGLDEAQSWVVISEVNEFIWPGPDLRPVSRGRGRFDYGFLPPPHSIGRYVSG